MKVLVYIFFLCCLFPYVEVLMIGTDTQPNAILVGVLILLFMKNKVINYPLMALWSMFFLSLLFAFDSNLDNFTTVKTTLNYLSPAIVATITYNILSNTKFRISFRFFFSAVMIYFVIGFVQHYFISHFMTFLLSMARGIHMHGRGVISLTNEPAFYGITCLMMMIFSLMNYSKKQNLLCIPILLYQLLFLAKTTTAFGVLIVALAIFGVIQTIRMKLWYVLGFVVVIVIGSITYTHLLKVYEDTRVGKLAEEFIEDPLMLAQVDESASIRLTGTFAPILGIKENYFLPFGFGRYNSFISELYYGRKYRKLIIPYTLKFKDKIEGGLNAVLFHFGFLGLLFPLGIYFSFKGLLGRPEYLFSLILFYLLLVNIQLMNAMIGLIIGYTLYSTTDFSHNTERDES